MPITNKKPQRHAPEATPESGPASDTEERLVSKAKAEALTPLRAIRAKCRECMGGSLKGIRICETEDCSLFQYRFGHNPSRKGIGGRVCRVPEENHNLS